MQNTHAQVIVVSLLYPAGAMRERVEMAYKALLLQSGLRTWLSYSLHPESEASPVRCRITCFKLSQRHRHMEFRSWSRSIIYTYRYLSYSPIDVDRSPCCVNTNNGRNRSLEYSDYFLQHPLIASSDHLRRIPQSLICRRVQSTVEQCSFCRVLRHLSLINSLHDIRILSFSGDEDVQPKRLLVEN